VLIVLGAGLRGERLSQVLRSRVDLAADYLSRHPDCRAVLSGGQGPGEDIPEAVAMARYLVAAGISEDRLILEPESTNTVENLRFSMAKLRANGLESARVVVVSNAFHCYRAGFLADFLGLEAETLGAPIPKIWLTPLNSYVREYFSIVLMWAKAALGAL
jgi:uncharacterized SAM-binding protein YcdF (DUF218 family)